MDGTCFRYTHPSLLLITLFKYLEQIVKKAILKKKGERLFGMTQEHGVLRHIEMQTQSRIF
jgi:hypothetical protein